MIHWGEPWLDVAIAQRNLHCVLPGHQNCCPRSWMAVAVEQPFETPVFSSGIFLCFFLCKSSLYSLLSKSFCSYINNFVISFVHKMFTFVPQDVHFYQYIYLDFTQNNPLLFVSIFLKNSSFHKLVGIFCYIFL